MNHELSDVQAGFRKGRGTRDQIANICWIIEKAREFQKNICFCFIDYIKAFDCADHNKLWKILKEMAIPGHLTCLFHFHQEALQFLFTSSAYLRLLLFILAILIPACASSSPTFCMMYSAYKLNKQGDITQPWHTPLLIWGWPVHCSMSGSNCSFLICIKISQEASKVVCYSHLFKNFPVCCNPHKGFSIVNEAEINAFLELSCFFYDPTDVGNLIYVCSAFSKSSLNIWKFSVHILLKPGLENFEHYFASVWDECTLAVLWAFFGIALL